MKNQLRNARDILKQYGQEHLLLRYDELEDGKKKELLEQIGTIDFELMERLYQKAQKPIYEESATIEPIDYIDKEKLTVSERQMYETIGIEAIKNNKLAVVTMAGGQGTRLGYDGPKGTFVFDAESNKTIFEALCDTLKEAMKKYGVAIQWYIMTSRENNDDTIHFFESNHYFSYPKGAVKFFIQGELPMLALNGKILLNKDGMIKKAANGHGGVLQSIQKNGILDEMKHNGIEWVFINGVDNVLVKPVDPIFMGLAIKNKVLGAMKSISKTDPQEKVGVICRKNKKVGVVEYTEISDEMANLRTNDGSLVYGDANALFNLYSIEGLERVITRSLPYHVAVKKAEYIDENGNTVNVEKPNAYKFEMFIFDSYEMFDEVVVLRVKREEEFAPIKNAQGKDSPVTARKMYRDYMKKHKD